MRWWVVSFLMMCATAEAAVTRTITTPVNIPQLQSEIFAIPAIPQRRWSLYRVPSGTLVYYDDSITPLTSGQMASLDAVIAAHVPDFTSRDRMQIFKTEVSTNDLCTAELADLTDRINSVRDSLNSEITSASSVATLKTALTDMNTAYAAVFRKVARCVRARAR